MKKLIALILAICLLATLFAGCSSAPADGGDKSSSKPSSAPAGDKDDAKVVDMAAFDGTWKLGSPYVAGYTIDSSKKTVTAFAANGIAIGTFPVVATEEGVVLKMGAFGMVTLKDASELVPFDVNEVTLPDISGDWNKVYGTDSFACDVWTYKADGSWTSEGTAKTDSGSWSFTAENVLTHAPTKDLLSGHSHYVLGGGDIIKNYAPYDRIYVRASVADTDQGKALINYYTLVMNEWAATDDANYTAEFTEEGKVFVSGAEMGIWYPTATGATVEMIDGSTEYIEFSDAGFDFYFKTFASK